MASAEFIGPAETDIAELIAGSLKRNQPKVSEGVDGTRESLRKLAHCVRCMENTEENAQRLLWCYQGGFIDDAALLSAVYNPSPRSRLQPVNAVTEPMSLEGCRRYLSMSNTTVMETFDPEHPAGPPLGVIVMRHAGQTPDEHAAFAAFVHEHFPASRVKFRKGREVEKQRYEAGLQRGDLLLIPEFVSNQKREVTLLLLAHLYRDAILPAEGRRGRPFRGAIAKCLEGVSINDHSNFFGNQRIRDLNGLLGMFPIADVVQRRDLHLPAHAVAQHVDEAVEGNQHREVALRANLTFGLYFGDAEVMREEFTHRGGYGLARSASEGK